MRSLRALCTRFGADRSGTVAVIFSLSLILLCMTTGLAIDASRAFSVSNKIAAVLDAAALAAAKTLDGHNATDGEVTSRAQAVFNAHTTNMIIGNIEFTNFTVTLDRSNSIVAISVDVDVPTSFGQLAGVPRFQFTKEATAIYARTNIELAMVLDVTGSMNSYGKIDTMKLATKDVINTILDSPSTQNKLGIAPFSSSVNVGSFLGAVANGQSVFNDSCVIERGAVLDDRPPVGSARANVMTVNGSGNPQYHYTCPQARVMPLTSNADTLRSAVDGYAATGFTGGHMGTAWGWYLVAPDWGSVWGTNPAAYGDKKTIKAVLIMTDGVFNTSYKTGPYQPDDVQTQESYDQFAALCTNMKNAGVMVFTVGFALSLEPEPGQTKARDALATCASSASQFFNAESNMQLVEAFQNIADQLTSLRIKS